MTSTSDILDPAALLSSLPNILPAESKRLASAQDGLAALLHIVFTALGFRLAEVNNSSVTPGNEFPPQWNQNGPGDYSFKYRHDQSSLQFIVKVSKLGSRTVFNAIALETDKVATFDISTEDFTSPSFYPHELTESADPPLIHGFISSNRVTDFVAQLKLKIIQKLIPGLQKDGYSEETEPVPVPTSSSAPPASRDPPPARPQAGPPPVVPDRNPDPIFPSGNPLEIGRSDLDPFPRNPFAPASVFPPAGGDGMFVGPNHPIFGIRDRNSPHQGPWGGDGYLPPLGAPPGARFDPVGPTFPNRLPRGPPGGRNGQDPDNDEFMPPGMDLHNLNAKLLAAPDASTSSYVERVRAEQAAVESRLLDVEGMDSISVGLKRTKIKGDNDMDVDEPEPATSRTIEAKKRALAQYGSMKPSSSYPSQSTSSGFTLQEAMDLERQAYLQEKERQERALEKKRRLGMPIKGEVLTRAEKEARIWAFMNHKPTDSDLEDDDEEDDDGDEDPASWFDDDQDDGRKGQDIVEPDFEDISDIIRIDESRIPYSNFYRPDNEGD
ncbi:hypothetical protein EST38_g1229 [Candolleomyces aberdarensis]|uniref:Uncharacterized protein n=1 Tax=Candolleomyces aberdarensis TaxID=2316362 RepID=A0A4Q2DW87_9AGAR|nr:hypothetical protein EST38_g1229 [Candolleomyces aberdarensis]